DLLFKFNAQHDCQYFSWPLTETAGPQQERLESKKSQKLINNADATRFLLNMHALHNAH
ncbi:hypothetical protein C8F04DRAFT_947300, partial [Mycena alexandri]